MLVRFSIPISDYYGKNVFFLQRYFEGDKEPSHEQVIKVLEVEHKQDMIYSEEYGIHRSFEAGQALESIKLIENGKKLPSLLGFSQKSTFVNHPKFGRQPLTVTHIEPVRHENLA